MGKQIRGQRVSVVRKTGQVIVCVWLHLVPVSIVHFVFSLNPLSNSSCVKSIAYDMGT